MTGGRHFSNLPHVCGDNFHALRSPGVSGVEMKIVTTNVRQIRKVTTACQVSLDSRGCVELVMYKSLSQQHQSNVFNHLYVFFSRGHRTSTCPLGKELTTLILVSFTFERSSILQRRRLLLIAITNKNIIDLSVWNWRIAFSCTWFS